MKKIVRSKRNRSSLIQNKFQIIRNCLFVITFKKTTIFMYIRKYITKQLDDKTEKDEKISSKRFPPLSLHEARYPAVEIIPGKGVAHTRHIIGRGERRGGGGRARPVIGGGRGKAGTPINANQIESREYEAYSQIKRIKAS